MGNTQQSKTPRQSQQYQYYHEKFKIVQISQNSYEMTLTIPYQQKNDVLEWEKILKTVKDCDQEFLLMPKKYMVTEQGICSSSGFVKVVYDCFVYSFQQQIKNHLEKFKYFQEEQIWYLLFAIVSSIIQMDRINMKVGDIRPYNIFVNQNGQVKLAGIYSWPKENENFIKTSFDKIITYLSPQQIVKCRTGQKNQTSKTSHSQYIKQESFSLGITLLHTCLLQPMQDLYNIKKLQFNSDLLIKRIKQLNNLTFWNDQKQKDIKYSPQLIKLIQRLLDVNQNRRLTSLQLYQKLQPHAEQILNLRQFQMPLFTQQNQQQKSKQRISYGFSNIQISPKPLHYKTNNYLHQSIQIQKPLTFSPQRPTNQIIKIDNNYINSNNLSQQYSSIKKKQNQLILGQNNINNGGYNYNDESLRLQMSYGANNNQKNGMNVVSNSINHNGSPQKNRYLHINNVKNINNSNNSNNNNKSIQKDYNIQNPTQQHNQYPYKQTNSILIHPRTVHYPNLNNQRDNTISKEKYQSNPIVKFNHPNFSINNAKQIDTHVHALGRDSSLHKKPSNLLSQPTQYLIANNPSFIQSNTLINVNNTNTKVPISTYIPQQIQKKQDYVSNLGYQDNQPHNTGNNTPIPSQNNYETNINNGAINKNENNNLTTLNIFNQRVSESIYPFSNNVNLTTSGYVYRNSLEGNTGINNTTQNYMSNKNNFLLQNNLTSIVNNNNVTTNLIENKTLYIQSTSNINTNTNTKANNENDFLRKIQEQLNKSKEMYPSISNGTIGY